MKKEIKEIKKIIFRLCQEAPNLEIIHWLIAIDNCFENDEFLIEEAENLRWRLQALNWQNFNTKRLVMAIEPVLIYYGVVSKDKKWIKKKL